LEVQTVVSKVALAYPTSADTVVASVVVASAVVPSAVSAAGTAASVVGTVASAGGAALAVADTAAGDRHPVSSQGFTLSNGFGSYVRIDRPYWLDEYITAESYKAVDVVCVGAAI
jgi:hypothetical protein